MSNKPYAVAIRIYDENGITKADVKTSPGVTYKLLLSCMELLGADETSELKLLIHHHRVIGIEFGGGNHAAEPNTVNLFLQRLDWFSNRIMPQALPLVVRQALQEDC